MLHDTRDGPSDATKQARGSATTRLLRSKSLQGGGHPQSPNTFIKLMGFLRAGQRRDFEAMTASTAAVGQEERVQQALTTLTGPQDGFGDNAS